MPRQIRAVRGVFVQVPEAGLDDVRGQVWHDRLYGSPTRRIKAFVRDTVQFRDKDQREPTRDRRLLSLTVTISGGVPYSRQQKAHTMTSVLIISGSPSGTSRTERLAASVARRVALHGVQASLLDVRDLPAEDLLHAHADAPRLAEALGRVAAADGVVVATPIYKAAYSGLLKTFLDVLPQFGLRGKVVLPLATGGSIAHVLAIDYALRPVLSSLDPLHVVNGLFLLDKHINVLESGDVELDAEQNARLDAVILQFIHGLRRVASAGI